MGPLNEEEVEYTVVRNEEEQYSIWPTFKTVPNGWTEIGQKGTKSDCLDFIEKVWTDITPKSVRQNLEKA